MVPQPVNIPLNDDLYVTTQDYICPIGTPFIIPAGYINDGASVPRLAWSMIRKDGLIRAGALVHDFICDHNGQFVGKMLNGQKVNLKFTWRQAAKLFHKINLASGLEAWRCNVAYEFVSMWGFTKDW